MLNYNSAAAEGSSNIRQEIITCQESNKFWVISAMIRLKFEIIWVNLAAYA